MTTLEGRYEVEMQIRREKMSSSFDRLPGIDGGYRKIGSIFFRNEYRRLCLLKLFLLEIFL